MTPKERTLFPSVLDLPHLYGLRNLLIFVIAYYLAYKFGMSVSTQSGAPLWFPDPVFLCALLLSRQKTWWLYILATLPVRLFFAGSSVLPIWFVAAAFANDSLKGVFAAYLTRRASRGQMIRFDVLRDLWIFVIAAVLLGPALSGAAGAGAWAVLGRDFWPTWRQWFLGDALANLVCVPLLICLARDWRQIAAAKVARYAEALVLFAGLLLAAFVAHGAGTEISGFTNPFVYMPLPFLVWAALRFGPPGASGALTVMSMLAITAASAEPLAISKHASMNAPLAMQLFILVLAIPIMSISILVEQQRRTEASLRESEERFRNMADTAPVLIWAAGPDKGVTFFNQGWLTFTGRTLGEELGNGWLQCVHPNDLDRCLETYSSAFDARRSFQMEYRLRRADGEYRWLLDNGVPRFEDAGIFVGYVGSCIDITDIKRAQEEALAHQKLETLGVIAAGIAHDFNNLVGSILAVAELAEAELAEGTSPTEEIRRIKDVGMRASEIVRELMIYSGQDRGSLAAVDVSKLVKDTLELLKVSVSKHVRLHTDLQPDLPPVMGSAPQIRQIVMNLIINASEAIGEKDGVIHVSTSPAPEGGCVRLAVSDSGGGMTPEVKARIFDPFFTTKLAGRGMGLAVVQGIVRDHGGEIGLMSGPGGTTFEILLPCTGRAAETANGPIARASEAEA